DLPPLPLRLHRAGHQGRAGRGLPAGAGPAGPGPAGRAGHEPRRRRALAPAAVRRGPHGGGERAMNIGLTYDLRQEYLAAGYSEEETAEFDRPDTVEAIESALRQLGHATDRIGNARQLVARLAAGDRWDLVFNICEGL